MKWGEECRLLDGNPLYILYDHTKDEKNVRIRVCSSEIEGNKWNPEVDKRP